MVDWKVGEIQGRPNSRMSSSVSTLISLSIYNYNTQRYVSIVRALTRAGIHKLFLWGPTFFHNKQSNALL